MKQYRTLFNRLLKRIKTCGVGTLCFMSGATLYSCSLDIPYENQFSDPDAINTVTAARELLASAYSVWPTNEFELSVLSDDFKPTYLIDEDMSLNYLYKWQKAPIEELSNSLWTNYYQVIATVNTLLDRVDDVAIYSDEEKVLLAQIVCEAKTLKAYSYFNLLRLFAPIYADGEDKDGIVLKDHLELGFLKRSSIKECVSQIRTLLEECVRTDFKSSDPFWLSQCSAFYLLAEVELYAGRYGKAVEHAQKVIDMKGGEKALTETNYINLWTSNASEERIFSLSNNKPYYGGINYDKVKGDYMTVNAEVVESYAPDDLRLIQTVYPFDMPGEISGTVEKVPYLGKYNRLNWTKKEVTLINKLRLSGAYFILAEGYCRDGKGDGKKAVQVLNEYLSQRKAQLVDDNMPVATVLKTILQEKRKEFVGEGERYFDLKRCRKDVLANWNTIEDKQIEPDDFRWTFPIPKSEYLYNDNMTQNDGWPKIEH